MIDVCNAHRKGRHTIYVLRLERCERKYFSINGINTKTINPIRFKQKKLEEKAAYRKNKIITH